jgi:hypothetical protein
MGKKEMSNTKASLVLLFVFAAIIFLTIILPYISPPADVRSKDGLEVISDVARTYYTENREFPSWEELNIDGNPKIMKAPCVFLYRDGIPRGNTSLIENKKVRDLIKNAKVMNWSEENWGEEYEAIIAYAILSKGDDQPHKRPQVWCLIFTFPGKINPILGKMVIYTTIKRVWI